MFKKCILHIGLGKTGTTSIQNVLQGQRAKLLEQDIYFAEHGPCHIFLASAFSVHPKILSIHVKKNRTTQCDIDAYNKWHLNALTKAAKNNAGKTLLLSCEHLSVFNEIEAKALASFLSSISKDIHILCYVREPIEHAISLHLEYVRNDRARLTSPLVNSYLSAQKTLEIFEAAFTDKQPFVRIYSKDMFSQGDVASDFLKAVGAEGISLNNIKRENKNARFSHEALLLSDKLNALIPQRNDGGWNAQRAQNPQFGQINGQAYQPTDEDIKTIQAYAEKDRKFLAAKYGIQFLDYRPKISKGAKLWQDDTLESLAVLLNQQALEIERLQSELAYRDGLGAKVKGDFEAAIAQFELSLALRPSLRSCVRGLAEIYIQQGNQEKAIDICKTHIMRNPADVYFILELVKVYMVVDDTSSALLTIKQALQFAPKNKEALRLLRLLEQ